MTPPDAWRPRTHRSPLTDPWEPLSSCETAGALQQGLHLREPDCNSRGFAHGGLATALADNAMGHSAVRQAPIARGSATFRMV